MALFAKAPPSKTALILDIENGSVGSALVELSEGAPRMSAESRIEVPLMDTRSAQSLARAVEHAASDSLLRASEVAARLRNSQARIGRVEQVILFFAAPWGTPNLQAGRPDFSEALADTLTSRSQMLFDAPVAMHAHASAAVNGLRTLYPAEEQALLLSVNGEVSELLQLEGGRVIGHATVPAGLNTVLRTLKSHAGLGLEEARSSMKLNHADEAAESAAAHFAGEFKQAARELFSGQGSSNVFVLAHEPGAQWFARALSHRSLAELFPAGGVVRAIQGAHLTPYVSSTGLPDAHLALDALYASAAHR